jgi:hypothetical protein
MEAQELERRYVRPEDRPLPWTYLGRGRGSLLLLSACGMSLFFVPWLTMVQPEETTFSGFELARAGAAWLWAGPVAWLVLFSLVLTRHTVVQMRGVRIISTLFASLTLVGIGLLVVLPASSSRVPVEFLWAWGLYASALVSAAGTLVAVRFGGRHDDLPAVPWTDFAGDSNVESSSGETLH